MTQLERTSDQKPCLGYEVKSPCPKVMIVSAITGLEGEGAPQHLGYWRPDSLTQREKEA